MEKIDETYKFKMTKEQQKEVEANRKAITDELKANGNYREPFITLANRYIELLKVCYELEDDREKRGVQVFTEKSGFKKNDSVTLLNNTNKQMCLLLKNLEISATTLKTDNGAEI